MKRIFILISLFAISLTVFSQQPTFWGDNTTSANGDVLLGSSCLLSSDYEEIPTDDRLYFTNTDRDALIAQVKAEGIKLAYAPLTNKYGKFVQSTLEWHAGELVLIKDEDIFQRRKDYKSYVDVFRVRKTALVQIASNINNYFQLPAVVVYNPNFFSPNQYQAPDQSNDFKFGYYYGEYARTYVQSRYVNSDWKRQSVRDIDRMPTCVCDATGNDDPNYYRCLMTCITDNFTTNMLEPKIAIIVRDITEKSKKQVGTNFIIEIDLHIKIIGLELADAVIVDEFIRGVGSAETLQAAYENAIKNAMDVNIDTLMFEESKVYYDYSTNGREVSIEVPYSVCNTVFEFRTFKTQLANHCLIRLDETTEDNSRFIRVLTTEARQSLVVDRVLDVLIDAGFQTRVSDIKPYANIIKIEGN